MDHVGVPKLKSVGRSVLLEDDDEGQDFATNAERLLKLVDQDFADVTGVQFCRLPHLQPLASYACTSSVPSVFSARQVVKGRGEVVILLLLF